ncbi:unnamed protein product [Closterium sp. Naga37s-1]|nr:unnamed protein product [Closterium sp. Naga37s-1]
MAAVAAANPSAAAIAPPSASAPPTAAEAAESVRQFRLERETELRVEVEWDAKLAVKLVSGTAEIFGSEIAVGQNVAFDGGEKFAVFTWHGCSLEVRGSPALPDAMYAADEVWGGVWWVGVVELCWMNECVSACVIFGFPTLPDAMYAADETPMVSYLNLHAVLNVRRVEAARSLMRAKQQLAQLQQQQQQLQYQHQQRQQQQQHPHQQQQYQHQLQRLQRHKQQLENKINSLVLTKVPRVQLVGPTDSGKSTLARMLLCWAARQQWHPTYVDLDVAHSSVTVPGAVAATPVEAPLEANARSVEEAPLVLFYGHTNPSANLDLYRALVTALADATDRRLGITPLGEAGGEEWVGWAAGGAAAAGIIANSMGWVDGAGYQVRVGGAVLIGLVTRGHYPLPAVGWAAGGGAAGGAVPVEAAAAGIIANNMGWVDGAGYHVRVHVLSSLPLQLLLHSIDALRANVVLVLGQERLYSMLSEHYRSKAVAAAADGTPASHAAAMEVVKLVRSGGAVSRASKFRQRLRQAVIKAYFYGPERQFSPHSSTASWSEYTVLRVGGGPQAPQSALPIGAARVSDPLRTAPVVLSRELEHHVLAVSHAKEEKDAVTGSIAGFICITQVDIAKGKFMFIAPSPGPLPGKILLFGSLTWVE